MSQGPAGGSPALRWPMAPMAMAMLMLIAGMLFVQGCSGVDSTAVLTVKAAPLAAELPRYGLNLGGSGTWGAEQLRANVLANPGFEPILDRTIVVVGQSRAGTFSDDTGWLSRPRGFWAGARYDVRSGAKAGQQGNILHSERSGSSGPDEFRAEGPIDQLRPGNVVVLTRDADTTVAPHWWKGRGSVASSKDVPPGSQGKQSLRLLAEHGRPAEILHYLDNISDRAGKLLPVNGQWKLSFWARQVSPGASLTIRFDRSGSTAFLDTKVSPGRAWQRYELPFEARDTGPAGVLTLGFTAIGGEVLIDEAYLGEAEPGPGGFRRVVIDTLQTLHPGYLRDWQGQLGDTLQNRLSGELAHRPVRYRPGDNESQFHYGLPDFLALCAAIKAQPWVVAPTTLSDDEWKKLGAYLRSAADQHGFKEIHVEFGNENWNTIFRPGGIPDPRSLGEVADRGFKLMREGAANDKRLHTVVNAQFVNPDNPRQVAAFSREADRISVAPYFMYQLDAGDSADQALKLAFADSPQLLVEEAAATAKAGKQLSVYEVNFHTTLGTASGEQRNQVTTGAAGGAALARRLLQASLSGVREQAAYSFSGFDSYFGATNSLVRLWGITRDLSVANRLRPTGQALAMLNRIAGGRPHAVLCSGSPCGALTSMAFGDGNRIAIINGGAQAVPISVVRNCPGEASYRLRLLDGTDARRNNETRAEVVVGEQAIACRNNRVTLTAPPFSLLTLEPESPG